MYIYIYIQTHIYMPTIDAPHNAARGNAEWSHDVLPELTSDILHVREQ